MWLHCEQQVHPYKVYSYTISKLIVMFHNYICRSTIDRSYRYIQWIVNVDRDLSQWVLSASILTKCILWFSSFAILKHMSAFRIEWDKWSATVLKSFSFIIWKLQSPLYFNEPFTIHHFSFHAKYRSTLMQSIGCNSSGNSKTLPSSKWPKVGNTYTTM